MTSVPTVRGWYAHQDDPAGIQRWFDGRGWTNSTTGSAKDGSPVPTVPAAPEPLASAAPAIAVAPAPPQRGWYPYPGDPDGVSRWFNGTRWTNDLTGGDAQARAGAVRLAAGPPTQTWSTDPDRWRVPDSGSSSHGMRERVGSRRPYSNAQRIGYGMLWTVYSVLLAIASFAVLGSAPVGGLVGLVLTGICIRYAYRLWTFQARRLVFLIIF
jgi:hypothetical protein